jgi:hypothetical protein
MQGVVLRRMMGGGDDAEESSRVMMQRRVRRGHGEYSTQKVQRVHSEPMEKISTFSFTWFILRTRGLNLRASTCAMFYKSGEKTLNDKSRFLLNHSVVL